ncbi:MAG: hypothetical protein DDG60_04525, partial [Anaerolineae bacterium]
PLSIPESKQKRALSHPFLVRFSFPTLLKEPKSRHLETILKPGICLFDDGGWKLSSHSVNSWMSKIFLAQYVAEQVLDLPADSRADRAHADWWRIGCPTNPGIDQIFAGTTPERNFFYPRAVTSYLWLAYF